MMRSLRSLLFPNPEPCPFCSRPMGQQAETVSGVRLCQPCHDAIDWIRAPICHYCGRAMKSSDPTQSSLRCHDCRRRDDADMFCNRAVATYNPFTRNLISVFKYRGHESLAQPIGHLMADVVRRYYTTEAIAAVTFVPLHPNRAAERGFNQAERLAHVIGRQIRRPVVSLLARERETAKQSQKGRHDRLTGMDGVFRPQSTNINTNMRDRETILIVDDVYTTGATLTACVRALRQTGITASLRTVTFIR